MFRLSLIVALGSALIAHADASPLVGTYVEVAPERVSVVGGPVDGAILYLNRCVDGCQLTPGYEDSRTNRSSIIDGPVFIPEFTPSETVWGTIVGCVTAMYSDFGITVTDQDPGDTPHFEAIVAGKPTDVGFPTNVGGVAPFTCGVIDNSITFTFAGVYGNKPQQICHTIAQESAHAFGLDHELLCEDPMTYIFGCGSKCFQDTDAPCGESGERECNCGGSTQNSWQTIHSLFGASEQSSERVSILEPLPASTVQPGFHVKLEPAVACATSVEAWVDEVYLGEIEVWPFVFNTPLDLPDGAATIRAMVTDRDGNTVEATIEVTIASSPPPPPPPDPVDAGGAPIDDPEPTPDCGCAASLPSTGSRPLAGYLLLIALCAIALRRRAR